MEEKGQPEEESFYTSIQDFLSASKDASLPPTNYTAEKEAFDYRSFAQKVIATAIQINRAIHYPPAFADSVPKIDCGSAGSHQQPLRVSERCERSPPARPDLSAPPDLRLSRSTACSDSASTSSTASFKKCLCGDDKQQGQAFSLGRWHRPPGYWSVPTWAAISLQQHVRAASPIAERSGLQVQRSPRSVSTGLPAQRASLAPGCLVHFASTQHHVPARVPVMSARDLGGSYPAGRAASPLPDSATTRQWSYVPPPILSAQDLGGSYCVGRATSAPPDSATSRHQSPVPIPVMSARDLGGSYPAGRAASPLPGSATTRQWSYVPPPILSAQDLGGSYSAARATPPPPDSATSRHQSPVLPIPVMSARDLGGSFSARRAASPAPAPAWRQPNSRSKVDGSPRISATSGQSPCQQQVQKRCVASAPLTPTAQKRPIPVHGGSSRPRFTRVDPAVAAAAAKMAAADAAAVAKLSGKRPIMEQACEPAVAKASLASQAFAVVNPGAKIVRSRIVGLDSHRRVQHQIGVPTRRDDECTVGRLSSKTVANSPGHNGVVRQASASWVMVNSPGVPMLTPRSGQAGSSCPCTPTLCRSTPHLQVREQQSISDKLREVEQQNAALESMLRVAIEHWRKDLSRNEDEWRQLEELVATSA